MAINQRNDELINMTSGDLQLRRESSFSWKTACSLFQALPGLRGFWPMSAFESGGDCFDQSGNSRTLTYNGSPVYNYDSLAPYIRFDSTNVDYLSRADEAGLDILGSEAYVGTPGLTLGGWFRPEDVTVDMGLITKWGAVGNYSYFLQSAGTAAGDPARFWMSNDGTNTSNVSSTSSIAVNEWQFIAGRFNDGDVGAELAVWLNDEIDTAATGRNAIFNGNGPLNIGSENNGNSNLMTGKASMCFLCAAALSDAAVWAIYQHTRALFKV